MSIGGDRTRIFFRPKFTFHPGHHTVYRFGGCTIKPDEAGVPSFDDSENLAKWDVVPKTNSDPDRMDLRLADTRCMDEDGQKNPGAASNRNKST